MKHIVILAGSCLLALGGLAACGSEDSDGMEDMLAAPSELSGAPMGEGFHLNWKDNSSDEQEFVVEQKVGNGSFTELARVTFNTTQYMVESGTAGQPHRFRVMAHGADGMMSEPSNEVTWTP